MKRTPDRRVCAKAGAEQVGSAIEIDRLSDSPVHDAVREVAALAFQQQGACEIVGSHDLHCRYEERHVVRAATSHDRYFRAGPVSDLYVTVEAPTRLIHRTRVLSGTS